MLNFQQITMPYLAAFVPSNWEVIHIDEAITPVDVILQVDLVAITFHTPSAPQVYELADQFRRRGIPVVLGGPHVMLLPNEAQLHADAIFVGEAELTWPQFLKDFETGQYAHQYTSDVPPTLEEAPMARKDLYHRRDYTSGRLFATRWLCLWMRFLYASGNVSAQSPQTAGGIGCSGVCLVSGEGDHLLG